MLSVISTREQQLEKTTKRSIEPDWIWGSGFGAVFITAKE